MFEDDRRRAKLFDDFDLSSEDRLRRLLDVELKRSLIEEALDVSSSFSCFHSAAISKRGGKLGYISSKTK
jgi:hypothetical protein